MESVLQSSLEFYTLDEISSADKETVAAFCEEHIRKIKNGQSEDVTKRNAEIILRKHIADVRRLSSTNARRQDTAGNFFIKNLEDLLMN